jgi:hypothetical protein
MPATAGVGPDEKVLDLGARLRCRDCDAKGVEQLRVAGALDDAHEVVGGNAPSTSGV